MSSIASAETTPAPVASTSTLAIPEQHPTALNKPAGRDWWNEIGQPKYVVAPMVDQSELAWRVLSRLHGATLCYTPMFHAALFSSPSHPQYAQNQFDTSPGSLEGLAPYDRPLIVQFCANDKDQWLAAAEKVVGRCDAVDLNLGCPQGIARKGRYGAFLMEEWDLIKSMISHLHSNLSIPVIAKLRVFPALDKTLAYATHVFSAGAQLLTIHGRTREAKGRMAGLASWPKIAAVREHLGSRIPILANGGIPSSEEIDPCLEETGVDGIMSAEGNLYNPMLFAPQNAAGGRAYFEGLPSEMKDALLKCNEQLVGEWDKDKAAYAPSTFLASQYLAIVKTLPSTETGGSAIKAHLFKLFRPTWAAGKHLDLREMLGRAGGGKSKTRMERYEEYQRFVDEMYKRIQADLVEGNLPADSHRPLTHAEVVANYAGVIPYSHAQPYLRVTSPEPVVEPSKEEIAASVGDKRIREEEVIEIEAKLGKEEPAAKKVKTAEEDTGTVVKPSPPRCSHAPACINSGSAKCPRGACMACCSKGADGATVELCEFHEDRARKEREKVEMKKEKNKAKRQAAVAAKKERKAEEGKVEDVAA
ncbi:trna-dihydrouridine synthase 1 [Pseudohyphozyma bogoriensis]|nr:trna-dihydrouridine synthase 1 [Pseudohyphozyma bogoriensis]